MKECFLFLRFFLSQLQLFRGGVLAGPRYLLK